MPIEKLHRKDYRLILLCLTVAVVSLWTASRFFFQVFPEASIQFVVNRESSYPVAVRFLKQVETSTAVTPQGGTARGFSSSLPNLESYRHAALFDYDDTAKTFLERELGLERANRVMGRDVRLWRWRHRWFRPQQKEEVQVEVSPGGEITRFEHLVDESAPGADLPRETAQVRAEDFLRRVLGRDLSALEFVEVNSEKRDKRTDHLFRWKSKVFQMGDAQYRYSVRIQGGDVAGYDESLKVPEEWLRSYQKLRSLNETTADVAVVFLVLTILGMLVSLVLNLRQREVQWRLAGYFGLTGLVLTFLSQLNNFPISEFRFDTTDTYASFLSQLLLSALVNAGAAGAGIFLIVACAEPLYRQRFPGRVSLCCLVRWKGIRSKEFFLGTIIGLTLTFFFFAYDSVFYLIAKRLGAWAPADVPYSDLLNTRIPWAFVLFFGFFPAVSEEFISRMFSIPFFERLFRYRWVAVFLASFIWGFAHANYPNQPFYIRGIEVGVGGLIVSWAFLRFGIVGPLVWHYSVDAFYTAFLLLRSGNLYLMASGALSAGIMLIPFLVALVAYWRGKGFVTTEEITNGRGSSIPAQVAPETPAPSPPDVSPAPYRPLLLKQWFCLAAACLVLLLPFLIRASRFGEFLKLTVSREEATHRAEQALANRGLNWSDFRSVTYLEQAVDPVGAQYLLKYSGIDTLNRVYSRDVSACHWVTRFFVPLQEEEYRVYVNPRTGEVFNLEHILGENAAGASLEKREAQQKSEAFLKAKGFELDELELKEANSEKRKARQDYFFVWEETKARVGEAAVRLQVKVTGDELAGFSSFVTVPEVWRREREKTTLIHILTFGARLLLMGFLAGWSFWIFLRYARKGLVCWKPVLGLSLGLALLLGLVQLNKLPTLFRDYPTSLATNVFAVGMLSGFLISLILQFLFFVVLTGLGSSLYPQVWHLLKRDFRSPYCRDAALLSVGLVSVGAGLSYISAWTVQHFHQLALLPSLPFPEEANHFVPALTSVIRALQLAAIVSAVAGILIYLYKEVVRKPHIRLLLFLLAVLSMVPSAVVGIGEFLFATSLRAAVLILSLGAVRWALRNNVLVYVFAPLFLGLLQSGYLLTIQSSRFLHWNGVALVVIAGLLLLKLVLEAADASTSPPP